MRPITSVFALKHAYLVKKTHQLLQLSASCQSSLPYSQTKNLALKLSLRTLTQAYTLEQPQIHQWLSTITCLTLPKILPLNAL